jgi:putative transcriptional regulator
MDIRKLRKRLNLTQEQLAQKLGVSFTTVNRWEKGKNEPSPLALRALEDLENKKK